MTICVSVKVRDGLVLTTDSMSQIQTADPSTGAIRVIKAYSNARKLFQVGLLPIAVMSWGLGNIGNRSIQSFMLEFNKTGVIGAVADISQALFNFIKSHYDATFSAVSGAQRPALGFYVAGFSVGGVFAEELEFEFPHDAGPRPVRPADQFGASWRGIWVPFQRMFFGVDPRFADKLLTAGVAPAVIQQAQNGLQLNVVFDGMPVQDAVNFAEFIAKTTIGVATFDAGVASCGGPLQVATILPDVGFEWVLKPKIVI
jgi:hypothetical protein